MNSPYALITDAKEKILKMILNMDKNTEQTIIKEINAASTYPNMSKYQLAMVRINLADLYMSHRIYGSAYEHYKLAIQDYPKAPVKKKLKELDKIKVNTPDEFIYSCDSNIVDPELCCGKSIDKHDIYDEEWETAFQEVLSGTDEFTRSEFYRIRENRKGDSVLSVKELDILTLKAMKISNRLIEDSSNRIEVQ